MSWSRVMIFCGLGAVFLLGFNCSGPGGVSSGGAGGQVFGTLSFPEWMESADKSMSAGAYELRKTAGGELIFSLGPEAFDPEPDREWRAAAEQPGDARSLNYYFVAAAASGFKVRPATARDWERGEQVLHSRRQILANSRQLPGAPPAHTEDEVMYNGKAYRKTGDFWAGVVGCAAAGGKRLAVFSFDTPDKSRKDASSNFFLFLGGGGPDRGDIHIDLYDTASGGRLATAKFPFGPEHLKPSRVFEAAMWVDGQYLVSPLDPYSRTSLLIKVPAN